jgi:hypothetical protein
MPWMLVQEPHVSQNVYDIQFVVLGSLDNLSEEK